MSPVHDRSIVTRSVSDGPVSGTGISHRPIVAGRIHRQGGVAPPAFLREAPILSPTRIRDCAVERGRAAIIAGDGAVGQGPSEMTVEAADGELREAETGAQGERADAERGGATPIPPGSAWTAIGSE